MSGLQFVNINSAPVDTNRRVKLAKRETSAPAEFHKGYAVEGLPPGSLESAMKDHAEKRAADISSGTIASRIRPEWNFDAWLAKAKGKRVRTKPYELHSAAVECKALAEKAGWLRVEVRSISKGAA